MDRGRIEYLTNHATTSTRAHTIPPVEGQSNDGHENGTLGHRRCLDSTSAVRPGAGAGRRSIINPATGEVIASVPEQGAEDVDKAVAIARAAFESGPWPS